MARVSKRELLASLEDRLLVVALILLFAASIVTAALKVNPAWQTPLIFLALLVVIKLVAPVDEIHEDVRYLRNVADSVNVQRYPTVGDFYSDLTHAIDEAAVSLDLTHIRDNPPQDFRGNRPSEYFARVLEWAQVDDGRSVRRLIAIRNTEMEQWARELAESVEHLPNFSVRVVHWDIDAPAINMAIVDCSAIFLAISGEVVERTKGLGIEDEDVAAYFNDYFNLLWNCSVDIGKFLGAGTGQSSST